MGNTRQPGTMRTHFQTAASLSIVLLLAGCNNKPAAPASSPTTQPAPATMPAATRADAAKLAAQHPAFKLLLQKTDMPAILVVADNTTDAQLKSLLWYLRTEVQSRHFKELGIKPTATSLGTPVYTSGAINIYRGEKCAREMYVTSGPDPCGASIHKSASYHWGDSGDLTADSASITNASGGDDLVFTSEDGWQTDEAAHADPGGKLSKAANARVRYATAQNAKQSKAGSDIRFAVDDPDTQLRISSYGFATPLAQQTFGKQFATLEGDHLCAFGFRSLQLSNRGASAKTYPVQCAANNK